MGNLPISSMRGRHVLRDILIRRARSLSGDSRFRASSVPAEPTPPVSSDSLEEEVNSTIKVGNLIGFQMQGKDDLVRASIIGDGAQGFNP